MTAPDTLVDEITAALQRRPDVRVSYLFGSQARGTSHELSDVDVAVLLTDGPDVFARYLDLTDELSAFGAKVDVVLLNEAPVPLAYRVLRDGRRLHCPDERARVHHFVEVVREYLDTEPLRDALARGMRNRLAEGRFGRP